MSIMVPWMLLLLLLLMAVAASQAAPAGFPTLHPEDENSLDSWLHDAEMVAERIAPSTENGSVPPRHIPRMQDSTLHIDGAIETSILPDHTAPEPEATPHTPAKQTPPEDLIKADPPSLDGPSLGWFAGLAAVWALAWKTTGLQIVRRLVGSLPLLFGFSRLRRGTLLEQETRRAIMMTVREHPAASTTEISESVRVAWGTALYHLRRLEQAGLIISEREGMARRHWDAKSPGTSRRKDTRLLRFETPRRIAALLREEPGLNQSDIRQRLGISSGSTSQQLRRLEDEGFVVATRGRRRCYHPTDALHSAAPWITA